MSPWEPGATGIGSRACRALDLPIDRSFHGQTMGDRSDRTPKATGGISGDSPPSPESSSTDGSLSGDDHALIAAARGGDERAFERLADRHTARLRRVLLRITRNPETAEDAAQDALLRAWQNVSRFQGQSSFFTWLTRIGINEAYRTMQRPSARPALPLDDAIGERIPAWGAQPDEIFESHEFLEAIEQALGRLPLDYRQAVVLRDVEGLSTREAAEVLEVEEAALKSRLHRGRMALRRELDTFFTDP